MFATTRSFQRGASAMCKVARLAQAMPKQRVMATVGAQTRFFSTDLDKVEAGAQKLTKSLEKEIEYENSNYTQLEDIEVFLNESGFTFTEKDDNVELILTKTVGNKTIEIVFEARQPLPDDENPEDGTPQNEEEEGLSENYCDFSIFISEPGNKGGLVIEATSMDTEISFNNVMSTHDLQKQRNTHRFNRQLEQYAGPDFSTLDERIQTSLAEFLEGFGVNEHLAAFVECMSLDKDQRLYMQWLSSLKDFIKH